jgi:hypothetical protein
LKPKPITRNAIARSASACDPVCPASAWTIPGPVTPTIFVDVVAPYAIATPYRKNADEKAPRRKYFIDASVARRRPVMPVSTYSESDSSSSARNTTIRSFAEAIRTIPAVAKSVSGENSPRYDTGSRDA